MLCRFSVSEPDPHCGKPSGSGSRKKAEKNTVPVPVPEVKTEMKQKVRMVKNIEHVVVGS